jgi:glycosyltransferase involved in cell wall biosynthesis
MPDVSQLKVCFLAGTLGRGGAERQLVYMLRALARAGVGTRVMCLTRGESFEQEIKALGVPVEWVGASASRPARLCRIISSLRREPADILQSVHFYTNLYVAVAGRATGAREIGAIRNNLTSELKENGLLGRAQLHLPRHLIANSALARQRAIDRGISPAHVDLVRNAVSLRGPAVAPSEEARRAVDGEAGALNVLFAGRLTEQKRPDRFLRVLSRIVSRWPERRLKIRIAGDGPLRSHVAELTRTLGFAPQGVEFLGELEDMSGVYREADLLVLTSDWEGTPNVLLEAMAYGVPIAATRVGGVPEIIADGRGLLADPEDEDTLTGAAMRLIDDSQLRARLARGGHDYVARHHSLDALEQQLTDIYQRILSR